ncbi:MAG: hypothetical protein NT023_03950, partial [Armatimonadetes bacterium]|nr:hypothetical protein [Armatimonadota bacterium]
EAHELLALFRRVAHELSWQPGEYLNAIPEQSLHFAGIADGVLAGGIQLALQDENGRLPCQQVWSELQFSKEDRLGHVTMMALAPEFRGCPGLFWSICVELWRYCVGRKLEGIILECTPPMFKLYRRIGWPLKIIGELRMHWGEECYLCQMQTVEVAGSLLMKAIRSNAYRELVCQAYRAA